MNTIKNSLAKWFHKTPQIDPVDTALLAFCDEDADSLTLLQHMVSVLRPKDRRDIHFGVRYARMLHRLENEERLRLAFRRHVVHFIASRRLMTFFTDSGILPGTGFFSEWWRILGNYLLPEVPDEHRLKDCLHIIFDRSDDWRWLEEIPAAYSQRLWHLLVPETELDALDWRHVEEQMLDAMLLIAHRVSGLGVESELMRASPNFDADSPRFVALSAEALEFVRSFRRALDENSLSEDDGSQLLVIADQCRDTLQRIRKRALTVGTSLHLSYLLTRSEQSLTRLLDLLSILLAAEKLDTREDVLTQWADFSHNTFLAENRRNSLPYYMGQLFRQLAVRVTENAAHSGEHYICDKPAAYWQMWRSALGGGAIIACMALIKIEVSLFDTPLFVKAFSYSLIYGLGFVLIYLCGLTVATKQPAMTAQTLVGLLNDIKPTRNADLARLVDVVTAVSRSQLAAIAGNVMMAFPVALLLSYALGSYFSEPLLSESKSHHLIDELNPHSWALPHAAIAGFYLFLSGLINGYFENRATYANIGERVARLSWLIRCCGNARAKAFGNYIEIHLGGIMGNFLFGCMLGSTGILGIILGLPIDIRHIAFASANLGYGLVGLEWSLAPYAVLWAALGVASIGFINLSVSFALALYTALRARDIQFEHWGSLLRAVIQRLLKKPGDFFLAPRAVTEAPPTAEAGTNIAETLVDSHADNDTTTTTPSTSGGS